jgi:macrolide transport system ATP-binding/permease protein
MTGLLQDFRYAIRQLRKNPGFAATSILILALGICASVAIFGFVDAALIKPLPYADPSRLVLVTESVAMIPHANLSYPDYLDWKKLNQVFSSMDVWDPTGYLLSTPTGTEPVAATRVSDGFFGRWELRQFLAVTFARGRTYPRHPKP